MSTRRERGLFVQECFENCDPASGHESNEPPMTTRLCTPRTKKTPDSFLLP